MPNQIDNVCDICLGKRVTLRGDPCICEDGSLLGMIVGLRVQLWTVEKELAIQEKRRPLEDKSNFHGE